jgi:hypothetical protein
MALHAAIARRALAETLGGEEGAALAGAADAYFAAQGCMNPRGFVRLLAPAFAAA